MMKRLQVCSLDRVETFEAPCKALTKRVFDSNQRFVGAMPTNMTRKNLGLVQRNAYYCTL